MRAATALLGTLFAAAVAAAHAEEPFDACVVFTQADAEAALGTAAAPEPANPKARHPRVTLTCTYAGFREGQPVSASAQFRFARSEADAERAFDEARFALQTKPLLIGGRDAFWSGRTGQLHLLKGRAWVTLSVGPADAGKRDLDPARRLAEILAPRI